MPFVLFTFKRPCPLGQAGVSMSDHFMRIHSAVIRCDICIRFFPTPQSGSLSPEPFREAIHKIEVPVLNDRIDYAGTRSERRNCSHNAPRVGNGR